MLKTLLVIGWAVSVFLIILFGSALHEVNQRNDFGELKLYLCLLFIGLAGSFLCPYFLRGLQPRPRTTGNRHLRDIGYVPFDER